jgi:hypothetical protein
MNERARPALLRLRRVVMVAIGAGPVGLLAMCAWTAGVAA